MAEVQFDDYVVSLTGATTPLAGTEVVPIVQGGATKKVALTPANIGAATAAHAHEGTAVLSTGEAGGTKFLREDGDGTSSWQAVPAAHDAVTLAGTPDYITISGQQITRGAIDLAADVTGTLPVANGGTGGTALPKLDDLTAPDDNTDLNATTSAHGLLPKLGGGTTNFLRADGTWAAAGGGGLANVVDDTTPQLGGLLDLNGNAITNGSGALTANAPMVFSQTWGNAAETFYGIDVNIANTASAQPSSQFIVRDGAVTLFGVQSLKIGGVKYSQAVIKLPQYTYIDMASGFTLYLGWGHGGTSPQAFIGGNHAMVGNGQLIWNSDNTNVDLGARDLYLGRDAAGILAQRNGANAQALRVYNAYTNASNHERGIFDWQATSNVLTIGTQAAGTGTLRAVAFVGASFAFPSAKPVGFLGATPASQQTHVADASTAHDLNATFSDTEVETALNNLGTKINSILTTLEAFGFHATA